MKNKVIFFLLAVPLAVGVFFPISRASAAEEGDYPCAVYFSGIGCPHCAVADPVVFGEVLPENRNFVVVDYEIYQQPANAPLIHDYNARYNSGLGIPMMIFGQGKYLIGDRSITQDSRTTLAERPGNKCPLADGTTVDFSQLDIAALPGSPNVWRSGRILIAGINKEKADGGLLRNLLAAEAENLADVLSDAEYRSISPEEVPLSGNSVKFEHAIALGPFFGGQGSWIFQWNGAELPVRSGAGPVNPAASGGAIDREKFSPPGKTGKLNIFSIMSLAAADAVNPCALAVLLLVLINILTYNPQSKRRILWSGLAFAAAVFFMYFLYGLVIIRFFQVVQSLTFVRLWLYKALGGAAILLGILNIRDFLRYRPGRPGTEMPLFMRPKVKRLIAGVTGPKGAFAAGIFVTLFLLPCTIGPYIICGGMLCSFDFLKTMPWLLLYNAIFILPMLAITGVVYGGIAKVEDVAGWKEKNIRRLHFAAGLIMLALGVAMVLGWV